MQPQWSSQKGVQPFQASPVKLSQLCTGSAQPQSVWRGHSTAPHSEPPGSLCQGPEMICIPGEDKSNFCTRMHRGAAVGWVRKGWRAATCSSLEQAVQEERWPRKSFLGSFQGHLQCAKPSWDMCPQLHVQTSSKSTPNPLQAQLGDPGCNT